MTEIVDSHCHLADPRLSCELEAVLERAARANVGAIVSVGAIGSIEIDRLTVEIAERFAPAYAVVGVHPHDAKDCDGGRLAALRELARSPKVVAIGESGLDFHYMRSPVEDQERSLRRHLELACELDLPAVLHCREAEQRLAAIVREVGLPARGGVIHCFTGKSAAAQEFLKLGFHISFSGIVTFKNAGKLRETAGLVPDERVMVETDAPYLAPEPYRGRRNEPSFVRQTLEVLAEARGTSADLLAALTGQNARRLFRIAAR